MAQTLAIDTPIYSSQGSKQNVTSTTCAMWKIRHSLIVTIYTGDPTVLTDDKVSSTSIFPHHSTNLYIDSSII